MASEVSIRNSETRCCTRGSCKWDLKSSCEVFLAAANDLTLKATVLVRRATLPAFGSSFPLERLGVRAGPTFVNITFCANAFGYQRTGEI